jgi:hypothetical protein
LECLFTLLRIGITFVGVESDEMWRHGAAIEGFVFGGAKSETGGVG